MEIQDILQNFDDQDLINLRQQSESSFLNNSLGSVNLYPNQVGSFTDPIESGIDDINLEVKPFNQDFVEVFENHSSSSSSIANFEPFEVSKDFDPLIGNTFIPGNSIVSPLASSLAWPVLEMSIDNAQERLESLTDDEVFLEKAKLAFGDHVSSQEIETLLRDFVSGQTIPEIEVIPAAKLNNANGAFGEGTIYLAEEFVTKNITDPDALERVLIEELGHYIDDELGRGDSQGDEGKIFAELVQDKRIGEAELEELRINEDNTTLILGGEEISVELSTPEYPGYLFTYESGETLSYDANVELWQQQMQDRGWNIDVDGLYGPQSESIARQFQQAKDALGVDGIVGPETWEATFDTSTPPFPGDLFSYEEGETLSYDANVELWQQQMQDRGWNIDVDGLYGPQSESIARQFQEENGLIVDGIVGPQTWEATFDTDSTTPSPEDPSDEPPQDPSEPTGNFREDVVAIARAEWEFFDQGALEETQDGAWQRIANQYWQTQDINRVDIDTPEEVGSSSNPWSAAFISWVMQEAGAGDDFLYSALHADYITDSIANVKENDSDAKFRGYRLNERVPQPGDLVGRAREEGIDYDTTGDYSSHVDIVVETRVEEGEIDVIGGNVSDSVTFRTLQLDSDGHLMADQPGDLPDDWFVVISPQIDGSDDDQSSTPDNIEFGDYDPLEDSEFVTDEFLDKTFDISENLGVVPEYLMAVMGFETGGTFDPAITNDASGATGLIQFLPSTAEGLGTTTTELAELSAVEQLDYVEQYYSDFADGLDSLEDTYLAVLYPAAIGKDEVFVEGTEEYEQNQGLDDNEDGVVTPTETTENVRGFLPGEQLFASYRDGTAVA